MAQNNKTSSVLVALELDWIYCHNILLSELAPTPALAYSNSRWNHFEQAVGVELSLHLMVVMGRCYRLSRKGFVCSKRCRFRRLDRLG